MPELRLAVRRLRRRPVFAVVAVLTIALGVGGTTAIFSLLYQLLLRPLPYKDAGRLMFVWNSYPRMALPRAAVSIPDYLDRIQQAPSIEAATLVTARSLNLGMGERPEQLRALAVTPSFFATFGRDPEFGRAFADADAQPGSDHVVILAHGLWRSRFASDSGIIGKDIRLSGEPYRVVGILPADFELPALDVTLLVPFAFTPEQRTDQERGREFSQMIARLAPGASISGVDAEMSTIIRRNLERLPERRPFVEQSGFRGYAVPIREQLVGDVRTPLYLLQAGVLLVLLIACVNVANLMLMRTSERQREFAVRVAFGAGRRELVRQLLVEGLVISTAGAASGILIAVALLPGLGALVADQLPATVDVTPHAPMLLAAAFLALVVGLFVGVVPASAILRGDMMGALNEEGVRSAGSRRSARMHSALVVAEIALALTLLVGAGLLMKSFASLRATEPGFSPVHVLTATLSLPAVTYERPEDRTGFWNHLLDNARAIPGVTAAGLTSNIPLSGNVGSGSYSIVGFTPGPGEVAPHGRQEVVGGDYFDAMEIPLRDGRTFDQRDGPEAPPVVIVDEFLVQRYFQGRSPLGRQIRRGGPDSPPITIVGVVGTINAIDLAQPVDKERLYYPVAQQSRATMAVVLKTGVEPSTIVGPLRQAVHGIDPEQPLSTVRTMEEWMTRSMVTRRAPMLLFAAFGGVALLLAAIGTYGVLAFGVSQRTRELGIRQALGAGRPALVALILRQGLRRVAFGTALGIAGAFGVSQLLRSQLYGVLPGDPRVLAASTLLLLAVTTAACSIPALRAARLHPSDALRES
jgi:putative ABC transport system permease protein